MTAPDFLSRRVFWVGACGLALGSACRGSVAAPLTPPPLIFAAISLKPALDRIATAWPASGPDRQFSMSYGSSAALAKQLDSGAPADIFAAADTKWMDWAAERGLIEASSRVDLIGNTLALIAPANSAVSLAIAPRFKLRDALGTGRLAVADPRSVPAGRYAEASLTSLGVWDQVKHRLATAENVAAALAFVARGEAPLGIVYGTDQISDPRVRLVARLPATTHPPIVYPFAITTRAAAGPRAPAIREIMDFLKSPVASAIFAAQGFATLAKTGG